MHTASPGPPPPPSFSTQKNRCPSEYHTSHFARLKKAEKTRFSFANFSMKVSDNLPSVNEKVVALCL